MASNTLAKLLVRIGADASEFGRTMWKAEQKLKKTAANMRAIGSAMTIGVTAPILAVGGASLKMAVEATESENLFTVSMGKMANAARAWSDEYSKALGMNAYAVRKNLGVFNAMLDSMGLGANAAFEMSKGLTKLAYDMASFDNLQPEEAFHKIQSGISGEVEPLKRLGIVLNEATVKQAAYSAGIAKAGQDLTEIQKIQARYLVLMRQTSKAQGDLARTIDSPANQIRILNEQFTQTAIELGRALLPALKDSMPTIKSTADSVAAAARGFAKLSPEARKTAIEIAGVLAVAGPLLRVTNPVVGALAGVAKHLRLSGKAARALRTATAATTTATTEYVSANVSAAQAIAKTAESMIAVKAGAVGLAAVLGWSIGAAIKPWVQEALGLNEALGLIADKDADLAAQLTKSDATWSDAVLAYQRMRKALHLTGQEWQISTERTEENASELLRLQRRLNEVNRERMRGLQAARETRHETISFGQALDTVRAKLAEHAKATEDLAKKYNVLTKSGVTDHLTKMADDFKRLKEEGVSSSQLIEAFGRDVAQSLKIASEYGVKLPDGVRDMAQALKEAGAEGFDKLEEWLTAGLPKYAQVGAEQVKGIMRGLSGDIADGLSGGFGIGADRGTRYAEQAIGALQRKIKDSGGIVVPLVPDDTELRRWYEDHGSRAPRTGGTVP